MVGLFPYSFPPISALRPVLRLCLTLGTFSEKLTKTDREDETRIKSFFIISSAENEEIILQSVSNALPETANIIVLIFFVVS